jgi:hypothetical protein
VAHVEEAENGNTVLHAHKYEVRLRHDYLRIVDLERGCARVEAATVNPNLDIKINFMRNNITTTRFLLNTTQNAQHFPKLLTFKQ